MKNYNNNYKNYNNNNKRHSSSNKFSTTTTTTIVQKKPDANNIIEFPTLIGDQFVTNTTSLDFKTASLMPLKEEEKKEELKPGWTSYTFENGKLKKAGYQKEDDEEDEEPFSVKAKRIIRIMVERSERYKENYINLYGEDTYHKMYSFPKKYHEEDDSCNDYEKGENENENENENGEHQDDYYGDYY